mmetsp:Transcript_49345/g.148578  ORF Transcript_49345/g.148578 Transcript_49345/m.148578 type:complete len:476 (-) Transcript_49345:308-1735(-)
MKLSSFFVSLASCSLVAIVQHARILVVSAFQRQMISPARTTRTARNGALTFHSAAAVAAASPFKTALAVTSVASAVVNIDEDEARDIVSMNEWATACGVQKSEGFQLTITDEDGRDVSVMTTKDIPASQPVLFVPNNMILTGGAARQEVGTVKAAEDLIIPLEKTSDHLPHFYLFLKILREYEMGDQSPWYPWLNSLPRYFSNGACMTHFCCSECLPPLVGKLANQERVRFIQFFRALKYVSFLTDETKEDRPLAKWAYAVVYTRCFETGDGDVRIVPMADMFNHGTEIEVETSYDEEGNCYAYTTYDVPSGYPLRISYGDPTNPSHLFARYGFLDESAPATFCKIMIPNPTRQLVDMGYDHSRMLFDKNTGEVSEEVWDVLLYQILGESNPECQRAFYKAHMNGDYETKQSFHEHYYADTSGALRNHVDAFLNQLEALSYKLVGRDPNTHPRLPLIKRHNEFVKNAFLTVRSRL